MKLIIDLAKVAKVYSGRAGACACGCSGKYSYAKQHQAWGSKNRGYEVKDEEVNDRTVKLIVNKIIKAAESGAGYNCEDDFIFTTVGNRDYVAYFVD